MEKFFWKKKGRVFVPDGSVEWMKTHAQGPSPIEWDGVIRTYFASRPSNDITLPGFIDLEIENPNNILYVHQKPILELGSPGTFDEHGIIPHPAINVNGQVYMYYIAWQRRTTVPYCLTIGLAISDDGMNFRKYSEGPILSVERFDHLTVTAPCIINHNGLFYMYYTAGLKWIMLNNRWEHTYTIRMATSKDGIKWDRDFKNVLDPRDEYECIACPTVLLIDGVFHMWFSYKGSMSFRTGGDSYRIGYAVSHDLVNWERQDDKAGITVSENKDDWDHHMIEYGAAIEVNDRRLLFYNGNGFSQSGFGYAELIIEK